MTPLALAAPRPGSSRAVLCAPWAISVGAHALLIVGALALSVARGPAPAPAAVGAVSLDALAVRVALPPSPPDANPGTTEPSAVVPVPAVPDSSSPALPVLTIPLSDALAAPVSLGAADWAPEPADVPQPPASIAPEGAPELFGARGDRAATRIVYVIDGSGAMVSALPNVIAEIERSIAALPSDRWTQAVVFRDGRFESVPAGGAAPRDAMIRADAPGKRGVSRWLGAQRASGRSDPLPALERALAFRPDVVFLVSKGLGDPTMSAPAAAARRDAVLRRLDALNPPDRDGRRHASIKVIQFFETDPGGLLQEIGLLHGGADGYTFISRQELDRQ